MRRISLAFCALAAALTLCACSQSAASSGTEPTAAATDKPAPAFSEKTADGKTLSLSDLKGKAVYLNFFATWCPPCNEEAPSVEALQQKYAAKGLQVVGVDVLENQKKAQSFVSAHKLTYPAIVDDGTLRDQYNINGLPVHVFIDRSGVVRKVVVGEMARDEIEREIQGLLRG